MDTQVPAACVKTADPGLAQHSDRIEVFPRPGSPTTNSTLASPRAALWSDADTASLVCSRSSRAMTRDNTVRHKPRAD